MPDSQHHHHDHDDDNMLEDVRILFQVDDVIHHTAQTVMDIHANFSDNENRDDQDQDMREDHTDADMEDNDEDEVVSIALGQLDEDEEIELDEFSLKTDNRPTLPNANKRIIMSAISQLLLTQF